MYEPSCTRVERCGGCCSHRLLECQPTEVFTKFKYLTIISPKKIFENQVEEVPMSVMRKELRGSRVVSEQLVTVAMERHLACACDCRAKEEVYK